jgi:hypothetical protein
MKEVIENGQLVEKWHLQAFNFSEIVFKYEVEGKLKVIIS